MKIKGKKSALKIHKLFFKSTRATSLLCLYNFPVDFDMTISSYLVSAVIRTKRVAQWQVGCL